MAEWLNVPHSKCGVPLRVPGVRIPPSPPPASQPFEIAQVLALQRLVGLVVLQTLLQNRASFARVAGYPYLYRRKGALVFRRAVPSDVRADFGKSEVTVSFGTGSLSEARGRWAEELRKFDRRLANARARVADPSADRSETLTAEAIDEAVRAWFSERREQAAARDFSRDDPDVGARLTADAAYESLLRSSLTPGPGPKRRERETEWIAEHLIETNGWHIAPNDGLYRHLLSRVARGELAFSRLVRSELMLDSIDLDDLFSPGAYQADALRKKERQSHTPVSITALLEAYAIEAQCKPATLKAWRSCLRNLVAYLGHDDAAKVTPRDIVGWKEQLSAIDEGAPVRGARTIRDKYLASAKAVLRWAAENHKIASNPTDGISVRVRQTPQLRERGLTDEEAAMVLSASLAYGTPARTDRPAFARRWLPWLCAYTGARVGEIAQLRREDVFQEHGIWCLRITPDAGTQKTGKAWTVPLHSHLVSQGFVKAIGSENGPIFFDPGKYRGGSLGNPQSKKVAERLAKWVRGTGVNDPAVQPNHGWRHRFKTQARLYGMDPEARDAIQGHSRGTEAEKYGDQPTLVLARALTTLPPYRVMADRRSVKAPLPPNF